MERAIIDEWTNKWFIFISKYYDGYGMNHYDLCKNPNITMDIVLKNPNIKWDWNALSVNCNITMDIVLNNIDKPWNWSNFRYNPNIYYAKMNWRILIYSPFIPINKTINAVSHFFDTDDCYDKISYEILTFDQIKETPTHKWNWNILSAHKNITIKTMIDNPNYPWKSFWIGYNPTITMDDILENPNIEWNWNALSAHPNITMENIDDNLFLPWNFWCVCKNPNLTFEFAINHANKMNWFFITCNVNITMHTIESNPNGPWVFNVICKNPNLTIEFVKKNIRKFGVGHFAQLSSNKFGYSKKMYVEFETKKILLMFLLEHYQASTNAIECPKLIEFIISNSFLVELLVKY